MGVGGIFLIKKTENRVDVVNGWNTQLEVFMGCMDLICFVSRLTFDGGRFPNLSTYLNLTSEDVSIYLFQCNIESL